MSSKNSQSTGAGSSAGSGGGAGAAADAGPGGGGAGTTAGGLFTPDEGALLIDILFSAPLATLSFVVFTYGLYTFLFLLSVYILTINKREKRYKILHIFFSCFLFVLVSAQVACKMISQGMLLVNLWTSVLLPAIGVDEEKLALSGRVHDAFRWIFIFINLTAEMIFLQRTFAIWNCSLKIIVLPVLLTLANLGIAIAAQFLPQASVNESVLSATTAHNVVFSGVFLGVNVFTNLVLTGMIAGRIWYTRYQTNKYLTQYQNGAAQSRRYSSLIAIIIESGVLYPMFLILNIILSFGNFPADERLRITHVNGVIDDLLGLIAAISPTLIIVRAGLGLSIETLSGSISTRPSTLFNNGLDGNPHQNIPVMSFIESISTRPESNLGFRETDLRNSFMDLGPAHSDSRSDMRYYKASRSFDSQDSRTGSRLSNLSPVEEVRYGYAYDGSESSGLGGAYGGYVNAGVPPGGLVAGPTPPGPPGGFVAGPQIARSRQRMQYQYHHQTKSSTSRTTGSANVLSKSESMPSSYSGR
ncbi:hypothetical protein D9758_018557 [Tetrapyrgos nigripes]|uniref:Uncharacterized protein n=1 Tax=Tetrapyrgos nigripes TaxID=182062 RepID=A0A8H5F9T8_9AGAR|nr:hypothetical protein D9758_018557 [Tetrapyrgos nigripes]